jgi:aminoglycoside 2'-N-acetyltransferase I
MLHRGRALRVGCVEAVAVLGTERRRGVGSALMAALEDVVRRAYDAGALSASDDGAALYTARGWQPWRGPTSALTPDGLRRTPDEDGSVYPLPGGTPLDPDGELTCDWRDGDLW